MAAFRLTHTHQNHADDLLTALERCKVRRLLGDMLSCLGNAERGDMEYNLPLNGSIDLDALDDFLMSDHAPGRTAGRTAYAQAVAGLRGRCLRPIAGAGKPSCHKLKKCRAR